MSSTQLATQLLFPALPQMAADLSLSAADTQQIVVLYFIGFGLSQLVYGPWTDSLGLRRVFYTGQLLFLLGSLLCAVATSPLMLAMGRVLQGLGAGAPMVLSRVILSTTMNSSQLKKALGTTAIAASVTSLSAPFIGGWLTTTVDWQFVFMVFTGYVVLVTVAGHWILPQQQRKNTKALSWSAMGRDYWLLLQDKRFMTAASFKWWPTMLFLSAATFLPFELQSRFDLTPAEYGSYMVFPMLGLIVGSTLARSLHQRFSSMQMIAMFWPLLLICALVMMYNPNQLELILLAYSCFMVMCGGFYPNALQLVLQPFKHKPGTATALLGAADMLIFTLLATLVNRLWVDSLADLGVVFLVVALIIAVNLLVLFDVNKRQVVEGNMGVVVR
jgi:MFS family permease